MKRSSLFSALVVLAFASLAGPASGQFVDTFDSIGPAWIVNRDAPAALTRSLSTATTACS